jgi:hypothetical protein
MKRLYRMTPRSNTAPELDDGTDLFQRDGNTSIQ